MDVACGKARQIDEQGVGQAAGRAGLRTNEGAGGGEGVPA